MLIFKLSVAAATIQSVLSCPAAKKTNLRSEGIVKFSDIESIFSVNVNINLS